MHQWLQYLTSFISLVNIKFLLILQKRRKQMCKLVYDANNQLILITLNWIIQKMYLISWVRMNFRWMCAIANYKTL